ncbi:MAG: hypothetical protein HY320_01500 [Armatimonadetes bacterium]|nr:hypothetical protein [Armatimonadota bacterium]
MVGGTAMAAEDKEIMRLVHREFAKRPIEASRLAVYASRGVVYLHGQISILRGHDINLKEELETVITILKQRTGIRDVINQVTLR